MKKHTKAALLVVALIFVLAASPYAIEILTNAFWITVAFVSISLVISVFAFVTWTGCYYAAIAVNRADEFIKRQLDR